MKLSDVPPNSIRVMSIDPFRIRVVLTGGEIREFIYHSDAEISAALAAWAINQPPEN